MIGIIVLLMVLIGLRVSWQKKLQKEIKPPMEIGSATFIGDLEVQADAFEIIEGEAGLLALLGDGFGKGNLGKVASRAALNACRSLYLQYKKLTNPQYFFKRAFNLANFEVLKLLEDRTGGCSLLAAFIHADELVYALAGDIKICVFRGGDLIPLSEGHTLSKLAQSAYKTGKLTKQKALWTLKEERLWNYIGQDGFKDIELYDVPVQLKKGDIVLMMTKGVYQNITMCEVESILKDSTLSAKVQAQYIINAVKDSSNENKENATVIVTKINQTRKDAV